MNKFTNMILADFHLHSKYSRATSPLMNVIDMGKAAKEKGLNLLGTGDFTHPMYFTELNKNLTKFNEGIFIEEKSGTKFILTTEICLIFSKEINKVKKVRKVHLLVFAKNFEIAEQINDWLSEVGNLKADGRPIFGMNAVDFTEKTLKISGENFIVPAHLWTPWFGILGSKSGFDSIEECFEDKSKEIYAVETGLSCYDEETDVLTNNGWKKFSDVQESDEICTLNLNTNKIEFQKPLGIFAYNYKGKMYQLKTKRVDLLVTPNHKLLVSGCDFRKQPSFFLKEAEFLFNKSKRFKKDGLWIGKNIQHFILPAVKMNCGCQSPPSGFRVKPAKQLPIKDWLKFFGFWIAEGWTNEDKKSNAYNVCLSNKDDGLLSEMNTILESFGYNVYWYKKYGILRVRDYQLFHYLRPFGKSSDKFIPSDMKSLSKELLEIFFEYYIKGDSHIYGRNNKGLSATTISIRLRDDLQEIALKLGMSAYYKLHKKKRMPFRSPGYKYERTYKQSADSWVIFFIMHNIHTVLPSTIKKYKYTESWVDFDGKVFSIAVPNHVIYVKRKGIPVWCGNSDPVMNWRISELDKYALISNSDSHSLHNLGRECNAFNFDEEKVNYQDIINAIKFKDKEKFLFTIEVPPEFGKYHYTGHRNCNFSCTPKEAINLHNICPVCNNPLTIGVEQRVEELADRKSGFIPKDAIPFKNIIPLWEICEKFKVKDKEKILLGKFNNEMNVLLNAPIEELVKIDENVGNVIGALRNNKHIVKPGYDGVYGEILTEGGNKAQGCKKKGKEKNNKCKEKEKSKGKEMQKGLDEFL